MAKIYLSYTHADVDLAREIANGLTQLGHQVDLDLITAGEKLNEVLATALKTADVFVSLLTDNSIKSQFVFTELGTARGYSQTSQKLLVIPVIFGDIPIPPVIQDILVIRSDNVLETVQRIHHAVSSFMGKQAAEEQKKVETKERIESNAASYVEEAIASLKEHEKRNRSRGNLWYYLGFITLIFGVIFGFYSIARFAATNDPQAVTNVPQFASTNGPQWIYFAYAALKSVIVIGLLIACSKYSFTLGKSYMTEALKSADRIHAISFGKFYLQAFGENVEWTELKEAFQHWNINNETPFSTLDTDRFDPKFLEAIVEVAKSVAAKK